MPFGPFKKRRKPPTRVYCTRNARREISNNNTNFIKNSSNYLGYLDKLTDFDLTKFEIERVEDDNSNIYSELDNKSDFIYSGDTIFIKKDDYYLSKGNDGKYIFTKNKYYAIKFIIEQEQD